MGGALAYHDVAPTALREHLLKFWYIEHRIPFTFYKKANVDVQSYPVRIPTEKYGTWYTAYTPDAGISCGVGTWAPFMVEVANTQKYGDLQTKRSYWQHGSLGGVKTIILMTYQHEDVLDNHTCILEVWKTAHRAYPGGEWQFPEPPPGMTYEDVDEYRRDVVMAAGTNQVFLGYREGPIYWIRDKKPVEERYSHAEIPLCAGDWFGDVLPADLDLLPDESYNPRAEMPINLSEWHNVIQKQVRESVKRDAAFDDLPLDNPDLVTPPRPTLKVFPADEGQTWH
ncbi:hypothetical protein K440DRAFT_641615 [Wilcoxina mikolae CBS 423.85]|nr:hypothetical protein K440DRAFT_641615 [Wilcoxina mikolae CBS 423.85]